MTAVPALTDDMKQIIAATQLCFAATVNRDGTPNLSPKSSLQVYDDDHLVFADIASPTTVENLRANPAIEINCVDIFRRRGYRFRGTAEILTRGAPDYESLAEWVWTTHGAQFPVNHVVKIRIDRALPVLSPAYTHVEGITEDALRAAYLEKYGVRDAATS